MFGWLRKLRKPKRLYVLETPYSSMFNLEDRSALERFRMNCPTVPATVRPMTDEEMRKYAD